MKRWRRSYYDIFSLFYDRIIAMHSSDKSAYLRDFLLKKSEVSSGQRLLDICTGTGAVAIKAYERLRGAGFVVGVDFSRGMLKRAADKVTGAGENISFVLADTAELPFKNRTFHVVTCSHAMYELDPETRDLTLREVVRVLVPGGRFIMMEHMEPSKFFVRLLYRIRLAAMGSSANREFALDERPVLARFFQDVKLEKAPTGRSKIVYGTKEKGDIRV